MRRHECLEIKHSRKAWCLVAPEKMDRTKYLIGHYNFIICFNYSSECSAGPKLNKVNDLFNDRERRNGSHF